MHVPSVRTGPPVLLAPGAGGSLDGAGLIALATLLAELGCPVVRMNLPHHERRRPAPRAERSLDAYRGLLAAAAQLLGEPGPWVVGGRSYGGRVASMVVADCAPVVIAGLLLYGYPLHPPGRPESLRVDHWPRIAVPTLFLQGDRDVFCRLDLLHAVLDTLVGPVTLHVVAGADHGLRITRAASPDGAASSEAATVAGLHAPIAAWLESVAGR